MDKILGLGGLSKIPSLAWVAGLIAVGVALWAFASNAVAALLMMLAFGACFWAAYEARRFTITPEPELAGVGLAELTPLLEALPEPALLIDNQTRIVGANAPARVQMRFEPRGQFLTAVLRHPDVFDAAQAAVYMRETRAVDFEAPQDVDRRTRCYVAPLDWGDERAVLLVFQDETARVTTERMRADFLANASHELRTPLASLTLLIETISGPARDKPEDRDRFLAMMQAQAERMRRLIDDLLSLSRIELDEHVPPSDRADLRAVANEVVDTFGVSKSGARVRLVIPDAPVIVVGDRFQLAQVVQNLIDNAIKYSPRDGEVLLEIGFGGDRDHTTALAGRRWGEAGRVALLTPASGAEKRYAFIRVEDQGPGMAMRFLPRLGERFFRIEREMGDERGGTGLGLAIVKHIVNRHRGGLVVESQPGRGSAFAAYIELADA